ncbi:MAG: PEP-CTERM sorting domain-containing protein [Phycisphaerales bacterium]|jgi:hypothetical protein|nr:PEP-CTERM sorting domain-containing protein [Phycisphaerales bacterium]
MKQRYLLIFPLVILFMVASPTMAGNPIINGGFEDPDIPNNSLANATPTGWTGVNWFFDGQVGNPAIWPSGSSEGRQYATTGLLASTNFRISEFYQLVSITWDATATAKTSASLPVQYNVSLMDAATDASIISNIYYASGGLAGYQTWESESLMPIGMPIEEGDYRLEFSCSGLQGENLLIDNVVAEEVLAEVSQTPEPASMVLLLAGSLVALKRRRRKN